ncbi:MAG: hypothetical protein ACRCYV_08080 [Aeromonas sp.]
MKKLSVLMLTALLSVFAFIAPASAGTVDGKMTKIRVYERGNKLEFQSRIPKVSYHVKKVDVLKAMTRIGKMPTIVDLEKNGIFEDVDRKVGVTLDRVKDGLHIRGGRVSMFITERELDKVRN